MSRSDTPHVGLAQRVLILVVAAGAGSGLGMLALRLVAAPAY